MCVCERERERESVCACKSESVCVRVYCSVLIIGITVPTIFLVFRLLPSTNSPPNTNNICTQHVQDRGTAHRKQ